MPKDIKLVHCPLLQWKDLRDMLKLICYE
jgi:hypothetical protein